MGDLSHSIKYMKLALILLLASPAFSNASLQGEIVPQHTGMHPAKCRVVVTDNITLEESVGRINGLWRYRVVIGNPVLSHGYDATISCVNYKGSMSNPHITLFEGAVVELEGYVT